MKKQHQHWDSYGVFCIAQMILKNNELDLTWDVAIVLYEKFLLSEYNVDTESELDCIHKFMQEEYKHQPNL